MASPPVVSTLIFDVDDTLYDIGTGFTAHRTGAITYEFMVHRLHFPDHASAKALRDEYFRRYHSTAKALQVAEAEGKFPPAPANSAADNKSPLFDPVELADYYVDHIDYQMLGGKKERVVKDLQELKGKLHLVAFSNGPRNYVRRVLQELGFWNTVFTEETLFAVDDVLPYCKPEKKAFDVIFRRLGVDDPSTCVMFEDSMKNIKQSKQLGMQTVLITGTNSHSEMAQQVRPGDTPESSHPAVDVAMMKIEELRTTIPSLWDDTPRLLTKETVS